MRFGVEGLGVGVYVCVLWVTPHLVEGLGFSDSGLGFRDSGLGLRVEG